MKGIPALAYNNKIYEITYIIKHKSPRSLDTSEEIYHFFLVTIAIVVNILEVQTHQPFKQYACVVLIVWNLEKKLRLTMQCMNLRNYFIMNLIITQYNA